MGSPFFFHRYARAAGARLLCHDEFARRKRRPRGSGERISPEEVGAEWEGDQRW
jgi:hypothetical protein